MYKQTSVNYNLKKSLKKKINENLKVISSSFNLVFTGQTFVTPSYLGQVGWNKHLGTRT